MKKILNVISSPRGGESYSIKLADALIEKLQAAYPGSTVQVKDLTKKAFPHLEEAQIAAFFTPEEHLTPESKAAIRHSDEAIAEIMDADILVIGAPMYNFNIPSTLKAWLDHIARRGVTFSYSEQGPEGLVKNKKAYIVIASGGIYSEGIMQSYDFIVPYLKGILGFIGITDVTVLRVEGVGLPNVKDTALEKAVSNIVL
ncbi:FMN-dependent NADH-azoreductase [Chitinophaga japonensis]|uniref:FMN dependent NADH:quinone oxidoreductase n=1 Tax=Chitinophaga japonensis TaxID=104662 RepID=A0A562SZR3_CHIJA|nr:FMN-dependent NADH-azoreductase [Chitinophaga japonensis]TWI86785.1 FMN-dependent NADH-azoreductase [Chitinophaga japonensis]